MTRKYRPSCVLPNAMRESCFPGLVYPILPYPLLAFSERLLLPAPSHYADKYEAIHSLDQDNIEYSLMESSSYSPTKNINQYFESSCFNFPVYQVSFQGSGIDPSVLFLYLTRQRLYRGLF